MRAPSIAARILVVEDDPDIASVLRDDLTLDGHRVELASSGSTALQAIQTREWDLIILDVMLPGVDGFEVCRHTRRNGVATPILFLTAKGEELERVFGFELGADDYVVKPFSPRELRARVKALLRRGTSPTKPKMAFGETEVDFECAEVHVAGKPVLMTATELRILQAFAQSRGRVLSREKLIEAAWGHDANVTDRAVDAHIVNLRRKVEPLPDTPRFIVSVRGLGYRFDC